MSAAAAPTPAVDDTEVLKPRAALRRMAEGELG